MEFGIITATQTQPGAHDFHPSNAEVAMKLSS